MVTDDLLFRLFPTLSPLPHEPKSTRLNKIYISTWNSSLSEINFSSIWINTLGNILLDTMADYPLCFTIITNNISSNPFHHIVVPFFWFLYIDKYNFKLGI